MDFQLIAESDESKSFKKKPKLKNVTLQKISANSTNLGKAAAKASLDSRQSAEPDMSSCQKYENFSFGNLMSNDNALGKASLEFQQSAESDKSNLSKVKPFEDLESNIFENVTNRCKATFTKVGVEFRPIAEQNDSNSHKTLNSKSHLHSKSNFPLKIKTSELDEADLEFQSNASSINKFSKNSDFVASLESRRKANKDQNFPKTPHEYTKCIAYTKTIDLRKILLDFPGNHRLQLNPL